MTLRVVEKTILSVRGQRVLLDADLAILFGVSTKALNQAVKRNQARFPRDFRFRLSPAEKRQVVTSCDHLHRLRYSPVLPWAFTEHGALMAANVLNSPRAVGASIMVVRAFVRLRELAISRAELGLRLDELEKRCDRQFREVFGAIRGLMKPPATEARRIGFTRDRSYLPKARIVTPAVIARG